MKRYYLSALALLVGAVVIAGLYWAYQTYWKPDPPVVQEQDAVINTNITALLADLPPAVPDLATYPVTVENCGRPLPFTTPPQRACGLWALW